MVRHAALFGTLAAGNVTAATELSYAANLALLPDDLAASFILLDRDEGTEAFLATCQQFTWASLIAPLLTYFWSVTDTNAWLDRGHMFVLSTAQARTLLGGAEFGRMLDIGAGDGLVTAQLAPLAREVVATEASAPMVARLNERGIPAVQTVDLDSAELGDPFDLICLLNVLDRADKPLTLLRQIKARLAPGGRVLLAVVFPFRPHVESDSRYLPPTEKVLLGACCSSWEENVRRAVAEVFTPLGLRVEAVSRVPYLSQGDLRQWVYELSDAVFVLSSSSSSSGGDGSCGAAGPSAV